ncbi:Muramoyltetrapeptide carboxypeptidase (LD-carboxypeptidase A) [Candidatus Glomeribacter gigasporarum BEG34]|uniref:Muramoyltetrapeptide carboxypeptidase (LD-carboxypeptidase A) n=1 Tax=Candidatus Glomeribacter gigasporarum BEG34 TaxID=1070319 RepID=G2JAE2_9BURK|nr:muramoyltetrapeptide carboxypeptidase [Candidatus Glomeribacter gigasporarum]CCD29743.1 Muramoyltetrapeptide carboxypeptidase (LD-carboxypeptidase A) [Candidatus Glomeribacter gigasporarum BEG34]
MIETPCIVSLVAPSGYPRNQEALARGLRWLRARGCQIDNTHAVQRRYQRFAGTDDERAADLNRLASPDRARPDIVLAVRGGYGATRILPKLDYGGLRRRFAGTPSMFIGYSDFTAIQMALLAQASLITFAGPMLCSDFGAECPDALTLRHFQRALDHPHITVRCNRPQTQPVHVSGPLWGGNLAILASLTGTPYLPEIDGGILFTEDVGEHPYRIERMLYQLHLAGTLARQQALVLGDFNEFRLSEADNGYDLAAMIEQLRTVIGIPIVTGLPFGHGSQRVTLPIGAPARLMTDPQGFTLTAWDYPHASTCE